MVFALRSDVRRRPDLGQQAGHLFLAIAPWGGHFILPRLHLLVQLHLDQRRRLDVSAQCSGGCLGDPAQPRFLEPGDVFLQVSESPRDSASGGRRAAHGSGRTVARLGAREP